MPGKKVRATYKRFLCSSVLLSYILPSVVAAQLNPVLILLAELVWVEYGGYLFQEFSFSW